MRRPAGAIREPLRNPPADPAREIGYFFFLPTHGDVSRPSKRSLPWVLGLPFPFHRGFQAGLALCPIGQGLVLDIEQIGMRRRPMRLEAKRLTCDGFAAAPGVEVPIHLSNAENTPPPKTLIDFLFPCLLPWSQQFLAVSGLTNVPQHTNDPFSFESCQEVPQSITCRAPYF